MQALVDANQKLTRDMVIARFSNETSRPLVLIVEPWATEVAIAAGSKFAVHYSHPSGGADTSFAEIHDNRLRFWCEGDTFEVEVDGEIVPT